MANAKWTGKTEFKANGAIKSFHAPMAKFCKVIREDALTKCPKNFRITIYVNKNNQIHDIEPRTFGGVYLFDKYHGRQGEAQFNALLNEALELFLKK